MIKAHTTHNKANVTVWLEQKLTNIPKGYLSCDGKLGDP